MCFYDIVPCLDKVVDNPLNSSLHLLSEIFPKRSWLELYSVIGAGLGFKVKRDLTILSKLGLGLLYVQPSKSVTLLVESRVG